MSADQLLEAQKVARLITGYLNKDLSDVEKADLDEWILASADNMVLFRQLTDQNNLEESLRWFRNIDEHAARIKIENNINDSKKRKLYPLWWAAAAFVMFVIGYVLYERKASSELKMDSKYRAAQVRIDIEPGKHKAVLITASGERIDLEKTKDAEINIGNDIKIENRDDELIYKQQPVSNENTLQVPAGGQYNVLLADGTKVWLNSVSTLRFPTSFNSNSRTVELEGEGYFEVAKDRKKPFLVRIQNSVIRVTGTHFNVHSYVNEDEQRITLLKGGIVLIAKTDSVQMKPEHEATISADGKVSVVSNSNALESVAWTKGMLSFNKASVEEVMRQIGRWYNVDVQYEGKSTKQFTGNIPMKSSLDTVLEMLRISGNVQFSVHGRTIIVRS
jgi:ferric-dicitrate binding protein FerR (iron transport regulator)